MLVCLKSKEKIRNNISFLKNWLTFSILPISLVAKNTYVKMVSVCFKFTYSSLTLNNA